MSAVRLYPLDGGELAAACTCDRWLIYWPAGADLAAVRKAADAHLAACQPAPRPVLAAGGGR